MASHEPPACKAGALVLGLIPYEDQWSYFSGQVKIYGNVWNALNSPSPLGLSLATFKWEGETAHPSQTCCPCRIEGLSFYLWCSRRSVYTNVDCRKQYYLLPTAKNFQRLTKHLRHKSTWLATCVQREATNDTSQMSSYGQQHPHHVRTSQNEQIFQGFFPFFFL